MVFLCLFLQVDAGAQPPPGTVLWTLNAGSQITSSPAIGLDGTIYFGTQAGLCTVTNAGVSGSNKWTFLTTAAVKNSPAVGADGTIYFGSDDSKFYAISPYGTQKWAYTFQTRVPSSPAIDADGTIYVAADGSLNALTPMGIKKWAYRMFNEQCSPIIGPGDCSMRNARHERVDDGLRPINGSDGLRLREPGWSPELAPRLS